MHQRSCPHTPQQNGLAERKHRHLMETTRTLLTTMHVPRSFWAEALSTSAYLINRLPTAVLRGDSPIYRLTGQSLDYSRLRVFGCTCYVLLPSTSRSKLDSRASRCLFLGYDQEQKGIVAMTLHLDVCSSLVMSLFMSKSHSLATLHLVLNLTPPPVPPMLPSIFHLSLL